MRIEAGAEVREIVMHFTRQKAAEHRDAAEAVLQHVDEPGWHEHVTSADYQTELTIAAERTDPSRRLSDRAALRRLHLTTMRRDRGVDGPQWEESDGHRQPDAGFHPDHPPTAGVNPVCIGADGGLWGGAHLTLPPIPRG